MEKKQYQQPEAKVVEINPDDVMGIIEGSMEEGPTGGSEGNTEEEDGAKRTSILNWD